LLLICCALVVASVAEIRREGQLKVFLHCGVDLDNGIAQCVVTLDGDQTEPPGHPAGKEDDFLLEPSGSRLYLQPRHGTLLAKASSAESGLTVCTAAQYTRGRMRIDGLAQGARICVRTNEGRYAELKADKAVPPGADRVIFSYRTWER
jgi:hypothetical protein